MAALNDTARFRAEDPDPLVLAAFACPVCLGEHCVDWDASLEGYDPSVECRCETCDLRWSVYLTPQQALRVHLVHVAAP